MSDTILLNENMNSFKIQVHACWLVSLLRSKIGQKTVHVPLKELELYMIKHCVPLGQAVFKWEQVKTKIYLP